MPPLVSFPNGGAPSGFWPWHFRRLVFLIAAQGSGEGANEAHLQFPAVRQLIEPVLFGGIDQDSNFDEYSRNPRALDHGEGRFIEAEAAVERYPGTIATSDEKDVINHPDVEAVRLC